MTDDSNVLDAVLAEARAFIGAHYEQVPEGDEGFYGEVLRHVIGPPGPPDEVCQEDALVVMNAFLAICELALLHGHAPTDRSTVAAQALHHYADHAEQFETAEHENEVERLRAQFVLDHGIVSYWLVNVGDGVMWTCNELACHGREWPD